MSDLGTLPPRVNELEKKVHTVEHQLLQMAKIPERLVIVEQKVDQLGELSAKIDSQNHTLIILRDLIMKTQTQMKTYVAWASGVGAVIMFLILNGEKAVKFIGKGVL